MDKNNRSDLFRINMVRKHHGTRKWLGLWQYISPFRDEMAETMVNQKNNPGRQIPDMN